MSTTAARPQSAAKAIKQLAERHGTITPQIVLQAARKTNSPLHAHFLWDDTEAAEKYRLVQAAFLIRKIKVEYTITPERTIQIRAFHNVRAEDEELNESGVYATTEEVMRSESYREQLLRQCRRDIRAFREKYSILQEVGLIIAAMENAEL